MPEVYSCSLKEIRRIKDIFVENWHFLLEVFRIDGWALALKADSFFLRLFHLRSTALCVPPLGHRPPQGAGSHPGVWTLGVCPGRVGGLEVLPFCAPTVHPLRMFPKHGRGQDSKEEAGATRSAVAWGAQVPRNLP